MQHYAFQTSTGASVLEYWPTSDKRDRYYWPESPWRPTTNPTDIVDHTIPDELDSIRSDHEAWFAPSRKNLA